MRPSASGCGPPGRGEPVQEGPVFAIEEDDRDRKTLAELVEEARKALGEVGIADVEHDGVPPARHPAGGHLAGELLEKGERQVVDRRVADVLERVGDVGLSGAGESRGDDEARPVPRHRALSRAMNLRRVRRAIVKRSSAAFRAISSCTFAAISRAALKPRRFRSWLRAAISTRSATSRPVATGIRTRGTGDAQDVLEFLVEPEAVDRLPARPSPSAG